MTAFAFAQLVKCIPLKQHSLNFPKILELSLGFDTANHGLQGLFYRGFANQIMSEYTELLCGNHEDSMLGSILFY